MDPATVAAAVSQHNAIINASMSTLDKWTTWRCLAFYLLCSFFIIIYLLYLVFGTEKIGNKVIEVSNSMNPNFQFPTSEERLERMTEPSTVRLEDAVERLQGSDPDF